MLEERTQSCKSKNTVLAVKFPAKRVPNVASSLILPTSICWIMPSESFWHVRLIEPCKVSSKADTSDAVLEKSELSGIPVLVLCNKSDLSNALKIEELIDRLFVLPSSSTNRFDLTLFYLYRELSKVTGRECR